MGLRDISGIGVIFGNAVDIFGEDYEQAPEPVVTDPTKMGVADPADLDRYLGEVALKTGLDKSSIQINDGQSIRIAGGDVKVFEDFLATTSYEHKPVGRLERDNPSLGREGDKVYTVELPAQTLG
jgi:hypothetical protein